MLQNPSFSSCLNPFFLNRINLALISYLFMVIGSSASTKYLSCPSTIKSTLLLQMISISSGGIMNCGNLLIEAIGLIIKQYSSSCTIGPPRDRQCPVEPVGVDTKIQYIR